MSDNLAELEHRFHESGSEDDELAWLAARVRTGDLEPWWLELSALVGHPAAARLLGVPPIRGAVPENRSDWSAGVVAVEAPPEGLREDLACTFQLWTCALNIWDPLIRERLTPAMTRLNGRSSIGSRLVYDLRSTRADLGDETGSTLTGEAILRAVLRDTLGPWALTQSGEGPDPAAIEAWRHWCFRPLPYDKARVATYFGSLMALSHLSLGAFRNPAGEWMMGPDRTVPSSKRTFKAYTHSLIQLGRAVAMRVALSAARSVTSKAGEDPRVTEAIEFLSRGLDGCAELDNDAAWPALEGGGVEGKKEQAIKAIALAARASSLPDDDWLDPLLESVQLAGQAGGSKRVRAAIHEALMDWVFEGQEGKRRTADFRE